MSARAFTQMNAAWTRGQSASAAAPPQKKTTSSYFRNHFNTWYKWPDSVLKHCYISLQVDQVWATFHPICWSLSHTQLHSSTFRLLSISLHMCKHKPRHTHAGTRIFAVRVLLTVRKEVWINISWPSTGRKSIHFPAFPYARCVGSMRTRGHTDWRWSFSWTHRIHCLL